MSRRVSHRDLTLDAHLDRMCAADFLEVDEEKLARVARKYERRVRRAPERMTREELARFLTPTSLVEIVGPGMAGNRGPAAELTDKVVVEQEAGFLESPGRGTKWQLTAAGRAFVLSS